MIFKNFYDVASPAVNVFLNFVNAMQKYQCFTLKYILFWYDFSFFKYSNL